MRLIIPYLAQLIIGLPLLKKKHQRHPLQLILQIQGPKAVSLHFVRAEGHAQSRLFAKLQDGFWVALQLLEDLVLRSSSNIIRTDSSLSHCKEEATI
jgi:hypothetical protein